LLTEVAMYVRHAYSCLMLDHLEFALVGALLLMISVFIAIVWTRRSAKSFKSKSVIKKKPPLPPDSYTLW